MTKFRIMFGLLAHFSSFKTIQAEGQFSLLCPTGFKAQGQAWYAASPDGPVDRISYSFHDNTKRLSLQDNHYHPGEYSVCLICINSCFTIQVEICIGHGNLTTHNLAYERRGCQVPEIDNHYNTSVWCSTNGTFGLKVNMSKGDLLSTLRNIESVTDPSKQSPLLMCPPGLQLLRFEAREMLDYDRSVTVVATCFVCSGSGFMFSSCIDDHVYFATSVLIPNLTYIGPKCPFIFMEKPSSGDCTLDVEDGSDESCVVLITPELLLGNMTSMNAKRLNILCPIRLLQGKNF